MKAFYMTISLLVVMTYASVASDHIKLRDGDLLCYNYNQEEASCSETIQIFVLSDRNIMAIKTQKLIIGADKYFIKSKRFTEYDNEEYCTKNIQFHNLELANGSPAPQSLIKHIKRGYRQVMAHGSCSRYVMCKGQAYDLTFYSGNYSKTGSSITQIFTKHSLPVSNLHVREYDIYSQYRKFEFPMDCIPI